MGVVYAEMMRETKNIFEGLNDVTYWPYIGKGYFKCPEKILVLGESHYLTDPKLREEKENDHFLTNDVLVGDYLDQNYTQSFSSFADFPKLMKLPRNSFLKGFRNTAKMLAHSGKWCSDYVWENLAFFNFFQKPVASRPGSHEWLNADYDNYLMLKRHFSCLLCACLCKFLIRKRVLSPAVKMNKRSQTLRDYPHKYNDYRYRDRLINKIYRHIGKKLCKKYIVYKIIIDKIRKRS